MPTIYFQYYESKFVSCALNVLIVGNCLCVGHICFQIIDMGLRYDWEQKTNSKKGCTISLPQHGQGGVEGCTPQ